MTVKSSISLTDQQHAFAKALVDSGRYSSVSAVIQQGLDMLHSREEEVMGAERALVALLAERQAGPFIAPDEMDRRMAVRKRDLRREFGLQD